MGTFWNIQSTKTPELSYFQERRGKPRFIRRMLKELREWHYARPLDL